MSDIKQLLLNEPEKVTKMANDIFCELDTAGSGFIERDEMRGLLVESIGLLSDQERLVIAL